MFFAGNCSWQFHRPQRLHQSRDLRDEWSVRHQLQLPAAQQPLGPETRPLLRATGRTGRGRVVPVRGAGRSRIRWEELEPHVLAGPDPTGPQRERSAANGPHSRGAAQTEDGQPADCGHQQVSAAGPSVVFQSQTATVLLQPQGATPTRSHSGQLLLNLEEVCAAGSLPR